MPSPSHLNRDVDLGFESDRMGGLMLPSERKKDHECELARYLFDDKIKAFALSSNGMFLAIALQENLHIISTTTGERLLFLEKHHKFASINAISFHPTLEGVIATAGTDKTVKIWSIPEHQELAVFRKHKRPVTCLDYTVGFELPMPAQFGSRRRQKSMPLNLLASGGADKTIQLYVDGNGVNVHHATGGLMNTDDIQTNLCTKTPLHWSTIQCPFPVSYVKFIWGTEIQLVASYDNATIDIWNVLENNVQFRFASNNGLNARDRITDLHVESPRLVFAVHELGSIDIFDSYIGGVIDRVTKKDLGGLLSYHNPEALYMGEGVDQKTFEDSTKVTAWKNLPVIKKQNGDSKHKNYFRTEAACESHDIHTTGTLGGSLGGAPADNHSRTKYPELVDVCEMILALRKSCRVPIRPDSYVNYCLEELRADNIASVANEFGTETQNFSENIQNAGNYIQNTVDLNPHVLSNLIPARTGHVQSDIQLNSQQSHGQLHAQSPRQLLNQNGYKSPEFGGNRNEISGHGEETIALSKLKTQFGIHKRVELDPDVSLNTNIKKILTPQQAVTQQQPPKNVTQQQRQQAVYAPEQPAGQGFFFYPEDNHSDGTEDSSATQVPENGMAANLGAGNVRTSNVTTGNAPSTAGSPVNASDNREGHLYAHLPNNLLGAQRRIGGFDLPPVNLKEKCIKHIQAGSSSSSRSGNSQHYSSLAQSQVDIAVGMNGGNKNEPTMAVNVVSNAKFASQGNRNGTPQGNGHTTGQPSSSAQSSSARHPAANQFGLTAPVGLYSTPGKSPVILNREPAVLTSSPSRLNRSSAILNRSPMLTGRASMLRGRSPILANRNIPVITTQRSKEEMQQANIESGGATSSTSLPVAQKFNSHAKTKLSVGIGLSPPRVIINAQHLVKNQAQPGYFRNFQQQADCNESSQLGKLKAGAIQTVQLVPKWNFYPDDRNDRNQSSGRNDRHQTTNNAKTRNAMRNLASTSMLSSLPFSEATLPPLERLHVRNDISIDHTQPEPLVQTLEKTCETVPYSPNRLRRESGIADGQVRSPSRRHDDSPNNPPTRETSKECAAVLSYARPTYSAAKKIRSGSKESVCSNSNSKTANSCTKLGIGDKRMTYRDSKRLFHSGSKRSANSKSSCRATSKEEAGIRGCNVDVLRAPDSLARTLELDKEDAGGLQEDVVLQEAAALPSSRWASSMNTSKASNTTRYINPKKVPGFRYNPLDTQIDGKRFFTSVPEGGKFNLQRHVSVKLQGRPDSMSTECFNEVTNQTKTDAEKVADCGKGATTTSAKRIGDCGNSATTCAQTSIAMCCLAQKTESENMSHENMNLGAVMSYPVAPQGSVGVEVAVDNQRMENEGGDSQGSMDSKGLGVTQQELKQQDIVSQKKSKLSEHSKESCDKPREKCNYFDTTSSSQGVSDNFVSNEIPPVLGRLPRTEFTLRFQSPPPVKLNLLFGNTPVPAKEMTPPVSRSPIRASPVGLLRPNISIGFANSSNTPILTANRNALTPGPLERKLESMIGGREINPVNNNSAIDDNQNGVSKIDNVIEKTYSSDDGVSHREDESHLEDITHPRANVPVAASSPAGTARTSQLNGLMDNMLKVATPPGSQTEPWTRVPQCEMAMPTQSIVPNELVTDRTPYVGLTLSNMPPQSMRTPEDDRVASFDIPLKDLVTPLDDPVRMPESSGRNFHGETEYSPDDEPPFSKRKIVTHQSPVGLPPLSLANVLCRKTTTVRKFLSGNRSGEKRLSNGYVDYSPLNRNKRKNSVKKFKPGKKLNTPKTPSPRSSVKKNRGGCSPVARKGKHSNGLEGGMYLRTEKDRRKYNIATEKSRLFLQSLANGCLGFAGCKDGLVQVVDTLSNTEVRSLKGHKSSIVGIDVVESRKTELSQSLAGRRTFGNNPFTNSNNNVNHAPDSKHWSTKGNNRHAKRIQDLIYAFSTDAIELAADSVDKTMISALDSNVKVLHNKIPRRMDVSPSDYSAQDEAEGASPTNGAIIDADNGCVLDESGNHTSESANWDAANQDSGHREYTSQKVLSAPRILPPAIHGSASNAGTMLPPKLLTPPRGVRSIDPIQGAIIKEKDIKSSAKLQTHVSKIEAPAPKFYGTPLFYKEPTSGGQSVTHSLNLNGGLQSGLSNEIRSKLEVCLPFKKHKLLGSAVWDDKSHQNGIPDPHADQNGNADRAADGTADTQKAQLENTDENAENADENDSAEGANDEDAAGDTKSLSKMGGASKASSEHPTIVPLESGSKNMTATLNTEHTRERDPDCTADRPTTVAANTGHKEKDENWKNIFEMYLLTASGDGSIRMWDIWDLACQAYVEALERFLVENISGATAGRAFNEALTKVKKVGKAMKVIPVQNGIDQNGNVPNIASKKPPLPEVRIVQHPNRALAWDRRSGDDVAHMFNFYPEPCKTNAKQGFSEAKGKDLDANVQKFSRPGRDHTSSHVKSPSSQVKSPKLKYPSSSQQIKTPSSRANTPTKMLKSTSKTGSKPSTVRTTTNASSKTGTPTSSRARSSLKKSVKTAKHTHGATSSPKLGPGVKRNHSGCKRNSKKKKRKSLENDVSSEFQGDIIQYVDHVNAVSRGSEGRAKHHTAENANSFATHTGVGHSADHMHTGCGVDHTHTVGVKETKKLFQHENTFNTNDSARQTAASAAGGSHRHGIQSFGHCTDSFRKNTQSSGENTLPIDKSIFNPSSRVPGSTSEQRCNSIMGKLEASDRGASIIDSSQMLIVDEIRDVFNVGNVGSQNFTLMDDEEDDRTNAPEALHKMKGHLNVHFGHHIEVGIEQRNAGLLEDPRAPDGDSKAGTTTAGTTMLGMSNLFPTLGNLALLNNVNGNSGSLSRHVGSLNGLSVALSARLPGESEKPKLLNCDPKLLFSARNSIIQEQNRQYHQLRFGKTAPNQDDVHAWLNEVDNTNSAGGGKGADKTNQCEAKTARKSERSVESQDRGSRENPESAWSIGDESDDHGDNSLTGHLTKSMTRNVKDVKAGLKQNQNTDIKSSKTGARGPYGQGVGKQSPANHFSRRQSPLSHLRRSPVTDARRFSGSSVRSGSPQRSDTRLAGMPTAGKNKYRTRPGKARIDSDHDSIGIVVDHKMMPIPLGVDVKGGQFKIYDSRMAPDKAEPRTASPRKSPALARDNGVNLQEVFPDDHMEHSMPDNRNLQPYFSSMKKIGATLGLQPNSEQFGSKKLLDTSGLHTNGVHGSGLFGNLLAGKPGVANQNQQSNHNLLGRYVVNHGGLPSVACVNQKNAHAGDDFNNNNAPHYCNNKHSQISLDAALKPHVTHPHVTHDSAPDDEEFVTPRALSPETDAITARGNSLGSPKDGSEKHSAGKKAAGSTNGSARGAGIPTKSGSARGLALKKKKPSKSPTASGSARGSARKIPGIKRKSPRPPSPKGKSPKTSKSPRSAKKSPGSPKKGKSPTSVKKVKSSPSSMKKGKPSPSKKSPRDHRRKNLKKMIGGSSSKKKNGSTSKHEDQETEAQQDQETEAEPHNDSRTEAQAQEDDPQIEQTGGREGRKQKITADLQRLEQQLMDWPQVGPSKVTAGKALRVLQKILDQSRRTTDSPLDKTHTEEIERMIGEKQSESGSPGSVRSPGSEKSDGAGSRKNDRASSRKRSNDSPSVDIHVTRERLTAEPREMVGEPRQMSSGLLTRHSTIDLTGESGRLSKGDERYSSVMPVAEASPTDSPTSPYSMVLVGNKMVKVASSSLSPQGSLPQGLRQGSLPGFPKLMDLQPGTSIPEEGGLLKPREFTSMFAHAFGFGLKEGEALQPRSQSAHNIGQFPLDFKETGKNEMSKVITFQNEKFLQPEDLQPESLHSTDHGSEWNPDLTASERHEEDVILPFFVEPPTLQEGKQPVQYDADGKQVVLQHSPSGRKIISPLIMKGALPFKDGAYSPPALVDHVLQLPSQGLPIGPAPGVTIDEPGKTLFTPTPNPALRLENPRNYLGPEMQFHLEDGQQPHAHDGHQPHLGNSTGQHTFVDAITTAQHRLMGVMNEWPQISGTEAAQKVYSQAQHLPPVMAPVIPPKQVWSSDLTQLHHPHQQQTHVPPPNSAISAPGQHHLHVDMPVAHEVHLPDQQVPVQVDVTHHLDHPINLANALHVAPQHLNAAQPVNAAPQQGQAVKIQQVHLSDHSDEIHKQHLDAAHQGQFATTQTQMQGTARTGVNMPTAVNTLHIQQVHLSDHSDAMQTKHVQVNVNEIDVKDIILTPRDGSARQQQHASMLASKEFYQSQAQKLYSNQTSNSTSSPISHTPPSSNRIRAPPAPVTSVQRPQIIPTKGFHPNDVKVDKLHVDMPTVGLDKIGIPQLHRSNTSENVSTPHHVVRHDPHIAEHMKAGGVNGVNRVTTSHIAGTSGNHVDMKHEPLKHDDLHLKFQKVEMPKHFPREDSFVTITDEVPFQGLQQAFPSQMQPASMPVGVISGQIRPVQRLEMDIHNCHLDVRNMPKTVTPDIALPKAQPMPETSQSRSVEPRQSVVEALQSFGTPLTTLMGPASQPASTRESQGEPIPPQPLPVGVATPIVRPTPGINVPMEGLKFEAKIHNSPMTPMRMPITSPIVAAKSPALGHTLLGGAPVQTLSAINFNRSPNMTPTNVTPSLPMRSPVALTPNLTPNLPMRSPVMSITQSNGPSTSPFLEKKTNLGIPTVPRIGAISTGNTVAGLASRSPHLTPRGIQPDMTPRTNIAFLTEKIYKRIERCEDPVKRNSNMEKLQNFVDDHQHVEVGKKVVENHEFLGNLNQLYKQILVDESALSPNSPRIESPAAQGQALRGKFTAAGAHMPPQPSPRSPRGGTEQISSSTQPQTGRSGVASSLSSGNIVTAGNIGEKRHFTHTTSIGNHGSPKEYLINGSGHVVESRTSQKSETRTSQNGRKKPNTKRSSQVTSEHTSSPPSPIATVVHIKPMSEINANKEKRAQREIQKKVEAMMTKNDALEARKSERESQYDDRSPLRSAEHDDDDQLLSDRLMRIEQDVRKYKVENPSPSVEDKRNSFTYNLSPSGKVILACSSERALNMAKNNFGPVKGGSGKDVQSVPTQNGKKFVLGALSPRGDGETNGFTNDGTNGFTNDGTNCFNHDGTIGNGTVGSGTSSGTTGSSGAHTEVRYDRNSGKVTDKNYQMKFYEEHETPDGSLPDKFQSTPREGTPPPKRAAPRGITPLRTPSDLCATPRDVRGMTPRSITPRHGYTPRLSNPSVSGLSNNATRNSFTPRSEWWDPTPRKPAIEPTAEEPVFSPRDNQKIELSPRSHPKIEITPRSPITNPTPRDQLKSEGKRSEASRRSGVTPRGVTPRDQVKSETSRRSIEPTPRDQLRSEASGKSEGSLMEAVSEAVNTAFSKFVSTFDIAPSTFDAAPSIFAPTAPAPSTFEIGQGTPVKIPWGEIPNPNDESEEESSDEDEKTSSEEESTSKSLMKRKHVNDDSKEESHDASAYDRIERLFSEHHEDSISKEPRIERMFALVSEKERSQAPRETPPREISNLEYRGNSISRGNSKPSRESASERGTEFSEEPKDDPASKSREFSKTSKSETSFESGDVHVKYVKYSARGVRGEVLGWQNNGVACEKEGNHGWNAWKGNANSGNSNACPASSNGANPYANLNASSDVSNHTVKETTQNADDLLDYINKVAAYDVWGADGVVCSSSAVEDVGSSKTDSLRVSTDSVSISKRRMDSLNDQPSSFNNEICFSQDQTPGVKEELCISQGQSSDCKKDGSCSSKEQPCSVIRDNLSHIKDSDMKETLSDIQTLCDPHGDVDSSKETIEIFHPLESIPEGMSEIASPSNDKKETSPNSSSKGYSNMSILYYGEHKPPPVQLFRSQSITKVENRPLSPVLEDRSPRPLMIPTPRGLIEAESPRWKLESARTNKRLEKMESPRNVLPRACTPPEPKIIPCQSLISSDETDSWGAELDLNGVD